MKISTEHLARVMFEARCAASKMTWEEGCCVSGDDHSQYLDIAELVADFINDYEVEAMAVAKYLLERVKIQEIESISYPPSRILP